MKKSFPIFLLLATLFSIPAFAATISVSSTDDEYDDNGVCSLREAITNTNNNLNTFDECVPDGAYGDDVIILTDEMVFYTLSVDGSDENSNISGDLDVHGVLTLQGGTIDASDLVTPDRIINTTDNNSQLTLDDVTLQNGRISDATGSAAYVGGCVFAYQGISLTIQNSNLESCTAQSEFNNDVRGGLLFSYIPLNITNSSFIGGLVERTLDATGGFSSAGSAIYADLSAGESIEITQSNFASNTSSNEVGEAFGAVYINGADLATIDNSVFYNSNTTSSDSIAYGSALALNTVTEFSMTNSTIQENTLSGVTTNGGGIYASNTDTLKIANSTLIDNVSQGTTTARGGALQTNGQVYLSFVTMANNTAGDAGSTTTSEGGAFRIVAGDVFMIHSIIANNSVVGTGTLVGPDCYSSVVASSGYNQIGDDTDCTTLAGTDAVGSVLNLEAANDNGGDTQTIKLGAGSAALDSAHADCLDAEGNEVTTDQRGAPRVAGSCDIGAYEYGIFYDDTDLDTFGNDSTETEIFESSRVTDNTDCNDIDAAISPAADEVCGDSIDNNCDGEIDDATAVDADTWYHDVDGDGYGDSTDSQLACEQPADYVEDDTDCDDTNAFISPGATELCGDDTDNNCDGDTDEGFETEGDTCSSAGTGACSTEGQLECSSDLLSLECNAEEGMAEDEVCDDESDNDCDGDTDADDADCAVAGDDDDDDTTDTDDDGIEDDVDNCPDTSNADQADEDADGIGDACDFDSGDDTESSSGGCNLISNTTSPNSALMISAALAAVWFIRMRARKTVRI